MVMEAVVESWAGQRERIRESAERIRTQLAGVARIEPSTELLSDEIVGAAVEQLRSAADMRNGGFGGAPVPTRIGARAPAHPRPDRRGGGDARRDGRGRDL